MFKMRTGVDMQHIAYKGSAQAIQDVIAGHIALSFENITVVSPHVKSGRVRGIAVTSLKRAPVLPEVPTIAESGLPGFEAVGWFGVVAPAATPREIIARLNAEIVRGLGSASRSWARSSPPPRRRSSTDSIAHRSRSGRRW